MLRLSGRTERDMEKKRKKARAADTEERKRSVGRAKKKPRDCLWEMRFRSLYRFQGPGPVCGGLAQLGERLPCKQEVSGSNPLISMKAGR